MKKITILRYYNAENISQTLIPEFLRKNFGKELFENLDQNQHISVKGFAGSVPSILVAELFLTQKKMFFYH